MANRHPSSKRYPPEVRERAVALVFSAMESTGERHGHVTRIARQLDIGPETLRHWVRQAEIDAGRRPGQSTEEHRRIKEPERVCTSAIARVRPCPRRLRRARHTPDTSQKVSSGERSMRRSAHSTRSVRQQPGSLVRSTR